MVKKLLFFFYFITLSVFCVGQYADFTLSDTICEESPVIISDVQPTTAISYKWSFCSGNASSEPDGVNMGNPNQKLNAPHFITLVQDIPGYFTFTVNNGNAKIIRCFYGTSPDQFPSVITDLGNFGYSPGALRGIQVKKDQGVWYGFVSGPGELLKLEFGASLSNTPTITVIPLAGLHPYGLVIIKEGSEWIGFFTDDTRNSLLRLDFGTNLNNNSPLINDLGNPGQLDAPSGLAIAKENDAWYAFICNINNSTLSRVKFLSTLKDPAPTGVVLTGITGLVQNHGISLISDCGGFSGFVTNQVAGTARCIVHLVFKNGLGGPVSGYNILNNGILNYPLGITDFVREGGTLYAFVCNYGSSSITRMFFPSTPCMSQPFYNERDPPPFNYPDPGNYNIMLDVLDMSSILSTRCKKIVVIAKPEISLGNDRTICRGDSLEFDAGAGASLYQWSTGETTRTITVDTAGTYWVHATNSWGCEAMDTVSVMVKNNSEGLVDTTICQGLAYYVQHGLQYVGGIYHDTLKSANGCDSIVKTTLQFEDCPLNMWFPNAFTPNGDALNDFFKPVGTNVAQYSLKVYDRWGALIFESADIAEGWNGEIRGRKAEPDTYTYIVVYEGIYAPGEVHQATGSFTLIR
jgi:gliding motility-associated-like protein